MSRNHRRRSAAELEADIARTRAALDRTAGALAQQLDTRHLFARTLDMIAESIGGNGEFRLNEVIRANSIPLALIGLGVGWLLAGNTGVIDAVAQDQRLVAARRRIGDKSRGVGKTVSVTGDAQLDDLNDDRRENGWVHQASVAARDAIRTVRETGEAVHLPKEATQAFTRHPLLVGVLGIAAGAALAALLPPTRLEDEWLGETRDKLRTGARTLAQDAVERVRNLAEDASP
jgi:hypothetical protein